MTLEEATIAQKYNLPVSCHLETSTGGINGDNYRIRALHKSYHPQDKSYFYSATLYEHQRAVYQVDIYSIEINEKQRGFYESKIRMKYKKSAHSVLAEYWNRARTKKELYKIISKEIDEMKKDGVIG